MNEIWKPLFEHYLISSEGRIKRKINSAGYKIDYYLKPSIVKRRGKNNGYVYAGLRTEKKGKNKSFLVHRLVSNVFLGKIPDGHIVNHIDGNPSNNSISNLEYVTPSMNIRKRHQTNQVIFKFTEQERQKIKNDFIKGIRICELAKRFNASSSYISQLVHNKKGALK